MTKNLKLALVLVCFAIIALLPTVRGDEWNKKTIFTFSGPVKVGNTILPAGTYVFKLMDSQSDRHIVQIFNEDENQIYATILAIPASRLEPADDSVITFAETSSSGETAQGVVPAGGMPVKQWFYPGDLYGQKFRIQPVAMTAKETTTGPAQAAVQEPVAEPAPAPEAQASEQPAPEAAKPAEVEATAEPAQETAKPATEPNPSAEPEAPTSLPKTGSAMPLVGLIGLLSLGTAAGLRLVARRRA